MLCFRQSQVYVWHMCKRIFKFELQLSNYWQNIKFSRYCPKFHIFIKIIIFQVYLQLFRPTASSLQVLWQGHVRNTLFHFCQLWAVNNSTVNTLDSRSQIENSWSNHHLDNDQSLFIRERVNKQVLMFTVSVIFYSYFFFLAIALHC